MLAWFRRPAAWMPIALSVVALAMIAGYVVAVGVVRHEDEGAPARIFQSLLLVQALLIGRFALHWLPRSPRPAAIVLAAQVTAAVIPVLVVAMLEA